MPPQPHVAPGTHVETSTLPAPTTEVPPQEPEKPPSPGSSRSGSPRRGSRSPRRNTEKEAQASGGTEAPPPLGPQLGGAAVLPTPPSPPLPPKAQKQSGSDDAASARGRSVSSAVSGKSTASQLGAEHYSGVADQLESQLKAVASKLHKQPQVEGQNVEGVAVAP